jgi:flavin reductase (DIM6/NTAB) family NADH-FMN oxidoreductase RutF
MFFEPGRHKEAGLPHNPLKALVLPRPIGWISSLDRDGTVNLAPYSFFNAVSDDPPMVLFSANRKLDGSAKDSVANIEATGEFVANIATYDLRAAVKKSGDAVPPEVDEIALTGLTPVASHKVAPPSVKEAPAHLECVLERTIALPPGADGRHCTLVLGRVVGIDIDEAVLKDGLVDVRALQPLARLGYLEYGAIFDAFEIDAD